MDLYMNTLTENPRFSMENNPLNIFPLTNTRNCNDDIFKWVVYIIGCSCMADQFNEPSKSTDKLSRSFVKQCLFDILGCVTIAVGGIILKRWRRSDEDEVFCESMLLLMHWIDMANPKQSGIWHDIMSIHLFYMDEAVGPRAEIDFTWYNTKNSRSSFPSGQTRQELLISHICDKKWGCVNWVTHSNTKMAATPQLKHCT